MLTCPFCESLDVELVAPWGGQLITQQYHCRACSSHFEVVREELSDPGCDDAP